MLDDQFDLVGQRHGLGLEPQLQPQARQERRPRAPVRVRRGHPELHERLAGGHRHRNNLGNPVTPVLGKPIPIIGSRSSSSITLGTTSTPRGRLLAPGQRQHRRAGAQRLQDRPLRARQPPLLRPCRTRCSAASSSGDGARTSPTASTATASRCSSRSSTTSRANSEVSDESNAKSSLGAACSPSAWCSSRPTPPMRAQSRRPRSRPWMPPTRKFKGLKEGKNADYIPALAKVDPNLFGIALVTADGKVYTAGDIKTEVSIQSISKVFTMAQVIQEQGLDSIEKRIGVDATGARSTRSSRSRREDRVGTGPGDEPAGQPGRHLRDEHGQGRDRRRGLEQDHRLPQRFRRTAADACCRTSTSPNPTPTSATRRSAR